MRKMLIIHPHWPPSNTVGVHRVRLIANELHTNGWKATVLTVDERDIEDDLAPGTEKLVAPEVEVIKVRARPVQTFLRKRLIGDIGLRAWHNLKTEAENQLALKPFDFIWFSIPSWYTPLMGPSLKRKYNVPYGVDYRDPWVFKLASHQFGLNRATMTVLLARILEPIAIRKAQLISGVSNAYLKGVKERNRSVSNVPCFTFQMGFRIQDHQIELDDFCVPFDPNKQTFVYAGAYSPNWEPLFVKFLEGIAVCKEHNDLPENVEFLFIGTANSQLMSISKHAARLNIQSIVREIPDRIPFLQIQQILRKSNGAMVIGSIEPHYSASKLFQCLVTAPRVFGFFHESSEGREILESCQADSFYVAYHPEKTTGQLQNELQSTILRFTNATSVWQPDLTPLQNHSSSNNARKFIAAVDEVIV